MVEMVIDPTSPFMGFSFAFFGGFAGFSLGSWLYHKQRLDAEKLESEKRLAALQAVKELMVTLAHYIRNSNLVIGGFSRRLALQTTEPESFPSLFLDADRYLIKQGSDGAQDRGCGGEGQAT